MHARAEPQPPAGCDVAALQGLARLMDVLSDSREIIRNEVLLVMVAITRGNVELQKIMAFEGAFDVLFGIVKEEEEGSIIASDCMHIICNLLKANPSNVTYFREMAGIQGACVRVVCAFMHGAGWACQSHACGGW